MKHAV